MNYGAAISLSTPVPRGLGGGASSATPPSVTFRVRCVECGPFKETGVLWEINYIFKFYVLYDVLLNTTCRLFYL